MEIGIAKANLIFNKKIYLYMQEKQNKTRSVHKK